MHPPDCPILNEFFLIAKKENCAKYEQVNTSKLIWFNSKEIREQPTCMSPDSQVFHTIESVKLPFT